MAKTKTAKKFKLEGVLEKFAKSKGIDLLTLTPQQAIDVKLPLNTYFESDVYSCITDPEGYYHKDGFALFGKRDDLSVLYLGYMGGENQIYGPVTDQKSKIVYSPSEQAIIENDHKRIDITINKAWVTYKIGDIDLRRTIENASNFPRFSSKSIEVYKEEIRPDSENMDFLGKLISKLF